MSILPDRGADDLAIGELATIAGPHDHDSRARRSRLTRPWPRLRTLTGQPFVLVAATVLVLIVAACAAAPLYAKYVAHTGPNANHLNETITVNGEAVPIVSSGGVSVKDGKVTLTPGGIPLSPQWFAAGGRYVLGADENGRDVAVRVLYGGRTSLLIGGLAAASCVLVALVLSLLAGFRGGWIDWIVRGTFDVMWAFPVVLLGVALGTALAINGFHHFGLSIDNGSLLIPIAIISFALVPYAGRPLRGQILSLRKREFVEAAIADGGGIGRVMFLEIAPNVLPTVLVLFALIVANAIILEAGLSYLGAGVQPPSASWGTLIAEGKERIVTAPWLSLAPGVAMLLTALSINVVIDAVRDRIDPRRTAA